MKIFPFSLCPGQALCLALSTCAPDRPATGRDVLKAGGGAILIEMDSNLPVTRSAATEWVRRAAVAVTNYLGRFPVKYLLIAIHGGGDQSAGKGVTCGDSRIDVSLGPSARAADLNEDWVLTHEMFHLAFPTLADQYLWMMEGLSDYLEPVARARAGQLTAQDVWRTRERIYWGGNLYWLLADVQIRKKTKNRHSIDDVIRAILAAGGDGGVNWTPNQVLTAGDKATGTTMLKDLHDELDAPWKRLGAKYDKGAVTFDNEAPAASIRSVITSNRDPSL